ncbi:hypothetical protein TanjilG_25392 [Lupinus angustifolius]|uniref:F-box domain-containing protein n=1 Tax=Lupinus angustifolius TaxID=3871 RepID=A0A1J7GM44_LUPAN|nr:PREDICTED: F-box protein SKIP19-like [Lupinus angustifolius]XP_019435097.1 PREDICTED: F-box protein SKIP19-like [Lupinus angustifolius]OIV89186.1 hypothetical protein TanjilG_25392 [Lupinus angustifolius]
MSSSSPSSSNPALNSEESETRNWLDLPRDVTATILLKLGAIEILNNAQRVCTQWRSISNDPIMWRTIDMSNSSYIHKMEFDLGIMCRHAIDRSRGNLVDISVEEFGTDDLLNYITDSTSHLHRLHLVSCWDISDEVWNVVSEKLPLLEELDITIGNLSKDALEAIGRCCPLLKSLKFNMQAYKDPHIECDEEAVAIAKTMPELRHLQLFGNKLTNDGLLAILDGCPHLESLDLRRCFNVNLGGSLGRRCAEQIKDLRIPNAPTDDYPYDAEFDTDESFDDDYSYGMSDIDILSDDEYEYYGFSDGSDYDAYDDFLHV